MDTKYYEFADGTVQAWKYDPNAGIPVWVVRRCHNLGDGNLTINVSGSQQSIARPGDYIIRFQDGSIFAADGAEFEKLIAEPLPEIIKPSAKKIRRFGQQ